MSWYVKICFENEGVVYEKKFQTLEAAQAFQDGFGEAAKLLELDTDDFPLHGYFTAVDTEPAKDEE